MQQPQQRSSATASLNHLASRISPGQGHSWTRDPEWHVGGEGEKGRG